MSVQLVFQPAFWGLGFFVDSLAKGGTCISFYLGPLCLEVWLGEGYVLPGEDE